MATYFTFPDNEFIKAEIDARTEDLFIVRKGQPQLQVKVFKRKRTIEIGEEAKIENRKIPNISALKTLRHESERSSKFFIVSQKNSFSPLDISRGLFEDFVQLYNIFSPIWKVVFTFGRKLRQNELVFPHIKTRYSCTAESDMDETYESACVLRRVERHSRPLDNPQQPPWSIRQTGVYHRITVPAASPFEKSDGAVDLTCLLLAPSRKFQAQLSQSLELSLGDSRAVGIWNIYRLLIADSLSGWLAYMSWLEEELQQQSQEIIYAKIGDEKETLSPLTDFTINFVSRQNLKILEDYVLDLQIILPTLLSTIEGLRGQYSSWCKQYQQEEVNGWDCRQMLAEFDEYVREADGYVKRAACLKERARSTTQLLADLLSYENVIQLKDVAVETQKESKTMLFLTGRSTKDAAAMKILTIISLIYLPSTIVSNFFSTQFVHTDSDGNLGVSSDAWILAACVVPLTAITIALWWTWLRCTTTEKSKSSKQPGVKKCTRSRSLKCFPMLKKQRLPDLEKGETCNSAGCPTWTSNASTAVE